MRRSACIRRLVILCVLSIAGLAACSGGGGGSTTPVPVNSPGVDGGIGIDVPLNQRVNFTVIVPPPATALGATAARRKRTAAQTAAQTNPYVSPNTGSVSLQLGTINGQDPRTLPASVTVNVACPSGTGCSVPIQNVPAAKGVDRFTVQTFSGPGATGSLISTGFIDVTVPSAQATSFGGTALTIGGFVQSLTLAVNMPAGGFHWDVPAAGTVDVNAIDPGGAIIIGNDQLANAIAVSLPATNAGAFTINGLQQLALAQPAQALALAYNGTILANGTVTASTTDENSQPVTATATIPLLPAPTPVPSPVSASKPPLSLYVYDAAGDRILEYAGINSVEGGSQIVATPRRIFEVVLPATLSANVSCGPNVGFAPIVTSMAVSTNANLYVQTLCADTATQSNYYNFVYSAATQEAVPAQGTPVPPIPNATFSVAVTPNSGPQSIKLDEADNTIFLEYGSASFAANIIGIPLNTFGNPTTNFGATCLQLIATTPGTCATQGNGYSSVGGTFANFALDGQGHIYASEQYPQEDGSGNPIVPAGDPSEAVVGEATAVVYPTVLDNPAPVPVSGLAGLSTELGDQAPPGLAIEGSTLFALIYPSLITVPATGAMVWAGLSGCPPPSPNAIPDAQPGTASQCLGGPNSGAEYLAGYSTAIQTLTAAAGSGLNLPVAPSFMIGGDVVGNFGVPNEAPGDQFAFTDGYAFVLNVAPPNSPPGAPNEIDVYNTNDLVGFHTDIFPATKLILPASVQATAIAIGATGTGVGGEALLRRPARVHHDVKAWIRQLKQRRAAQLRRNARAH